MFVKKMIAVATSTLLTYNGAMAADPKVDLAQSFYKFGNWSVGWSSSMEGCVATVKYTDGTTLWVGYTTNDDGASRSYIAITNKKWKDEITSMQEYKLIVDIDNDRYGDSTMYGITNPSGLLVAISEDLYKAIQAANVIRFFNKDGSYITDLRLNGSRVALNELNKCNNELGNGKKEEVADASPPPTKEEAKNVTGTGFFVTASGNVLTNEHVANKKCKRVLVQTADGNTHTATVLREDAEVDLSLLETTVSNATAAEFEENVKLGESAYTFGYPLDSLLSADGVFTNGTISSLKGVGNEFKHYQISVPIQPGNSGGPLVNANGNVIGVVSSKLNAIAVANITNDLPQNVNFAIKTNIARAFMELSGVSPVKASQTDKLSTEDIAEKTKNFTVKIECVNN